jgi:hypothetical protein
MPAEEKTGGKQKRKWKKKSKGTGKTSGYEPVAVPPAEELMKVYTTSLAMATDAFPKPLCRNPLPLLAAVIGVLGESESSTALPDESKT